MSLSAGVPHAGLVGRVAIGRRSHGGGRRRVDEPLDPRPQRFLQHDPGSLEVHRERLGSIQPQVRGARQMKNPVDASHCSPHRMAIAHVGLYGPQLEILERSEVRLRADRHHHLVSPLDQQPGDV